MTKLEQPTTAPLVVDRAEFDHALAAQVADEKEVTRHNDRGSAGRRQLPKRHWDHRWVSSYGASYHYDWGWTLTNDKGEEGQQPGYTYYLPKTASRF